MLVITVSYFDWSDQRAVAIIIPSTEVKCTPKCPDLQFRLDEKIRSDQQEAEACMKQAPVAANQPNVLQLSKDSLIVCVYHLHSF